MTENITLSPALPEDVPSVLAIQAKAFAHHSGEFDVALWTGETSGELLSDLQEMTVIVARSKTGEVLGSVRARDLEGVWVVRKLSVSPDHQRKGIGAALMRAIEEAAPKTCHKISVCTMLRLGENVRFFLDGGYMPDYLMAGHYNRLHLICFAKKPS
ncbi:MAG: GNAT family N-acetyltransferase [Nitrospiraceae bacterium]|jgi:predicted N-acetyltransferase YhbS|nr:GNAT family N-acetyltransferase [Nitrospiraceae bacterium]